MINKTVIKENYTVKTINKEVYPTTCMTNKRVIKKEVKHTNDKEGRDCDSPAGAGNVSYISWMGAY